MIEPENAKIKITRQCELLGLVHSSAYYKNRVDTSTNEALMNVLDEQYTRTPFYGVRRMTAHLQRQGYEVGERRVRRLLRAMGLMAVYPKKRLSIPDKAHKKYPYLLKDIDITRPDHVWCTDITYIRMKKGFAYLAAVMDWASRYVIAWELPVTLDAGFCVETLERALLSGRPEIFNSDQGSQFTSEAFTGTLLDAGVRISMDGRGRVFDNIFVERLWRSVKYEEVYLKSYESVSEARASLGRYFEFYNYVRLHQSLDYRTPAEVYFVTDRRAPAGCCGAFPTSYASAHSRRAAVPTDARHAHAPDNGEVVLYAQETGSKFHLKFEELLS